MSTDAVANAGSRPARYLHGHRSRIALWIAVVEGVLTLWGGLPHLTVYVLAAVAIAFYFGVARKFRSGTARETGWIFAASQVGAVLVPVVLHLLHIVAVGLIVVLAVAALIMLFLERDRR